MKRKIIKKFININSTHTHTQTHIVSGFSHSTYTETTISSFLLRKLKKFQRKQMTKMIFTHI